MKYFFTTIIETITIIVISKFNPQNCSTNAINMSSRNATSNTFVSKNAVKKYCKVCHDAGKPESVYMSHYTRETPDPKSKVVCPTLLSMECKYCFATGHTVKYCLILEDNKKRQEKENKLQQRQHTKIEYAAKQKSATEKLPMMKKNIFASLVSNDSDSENEEVVQKMSKIVSKVEVEEFPSLVAPKKQDKNHSGFSYASMAAKTPDTYLNEKYLENSKKRLVPKFYSSASKKTDNYDYDHEEEEYYDEEEFEAEYEKAKQQLNKEKENTSTKSWADYDTEDEL